MRNSVCHAFPAICMLLMSIAPAGSALGQSGDCDIGSQPQLLILGIAQDAGSPQAGTKTDSGFSDLSYRFLATSLALISPAEGLRWMFEATPDFRDQLHRLDEVLPDPDIPGLDGIFLTHAHIGHYLGLAQVGHEVMGASDVPVFAMPRMADFLQTNGPWDQLVRYDNIAIRPLQHRVTVQLTPQLEVTPFLVPHRDEYSETVGFEIAGPIRTVVFIPDINKWEVWDSLGVHLEDVVKGADLLFLDGTFYDHGELPGRDMSAIPHPLIAETMNRLSSLAPEVRQRVHFIHLNHTNPALEPTSDASTQIEQRGFKIAREGTCYSL